MIRETVLRVHLNDVGNNSSLSFGIGKNSSFGSEKRITKNFFVIPGRSRNTTGAQKGKSARRVSVREARRVAVRKVTVGAARRTSGGLGFNLVAGEEGSRSFEERERVVRPEGLEAKGSVNVRLVFNVRAVRRVFGMVKRVVGAEGRDNVGLGLEFSVRRGRLTSGPERGE
ncbi:hypothetical protein Bca4012_046221 [Brassica carinata]